MRFYLDSSVLGALFDEKPLYHSAYSRQVIDAISSGLHEGWISDLVVTEILEAPEELRAQIMEEVHAAHLRILPVTDESRALMEVFLSHGVLAPAHRADLGHIAIATVHRADAIISWNFKHIVNVRTQRKIHAVNMELGYNLIEIRSPMEVLDGE